MPLQQTSGAASYDAFGGGAPVAAKYIEDFFQSWLRTGTGSSTTVTTGLNASINKSLVWTKSRSAATNHKLTDTARGVTKALSSNTTGAEVTDSQGLTAFSSTGYTIGTNTDYNNSGATYVDWQWVATPKFFDVVTWTGNGTAGRLIPHNLGSVPGCVIIKSSSFDVTNADVAWPTWHRGLTSGNLVSLSSTAAQSNFLGNANQYFGNGTTTVNPDASNITIGGASAVNRNGEQYVAYLFAHNAGGFGLTGTDNVISCGSYTGNGSATGPVVTLGYEPQWLMIKRTDSANAWFIIDSMRGMSVGGGVEPTLVANGSFDESTYSADYLSPTATGFQIANAGGNVNASGGTYIYIAIRRGPMRTPTTGTSVFNPSFNGQTSTNYLAYLGQPTDFWIRNDRAGGDHNVRSRLTGGNSLLTNSTAAETASSLNWWDNQLGVGLTGSTFGYNDTIINYLFRRAPGFFDQVCYTTGAGTGITTFNHNLGVVPELVISKTRSAVDDWYVYAQPLGTSKTLNLNANVAEQGFTCTDSLSSTQARTSLGVGSATAVSYLFASCPGVQSIQSFVGDGTTGRTINCGFTGGARFVCIKATSTTGSWWTFDSARGIVTNNDPALQLNSTAAEVTSADAIDTAASGFIVNQESTCSLNASGVTYLVWAIA